MIRRWLERLGVIRPPVVAPPRITEAVLGYCVKKDGPDGFGFYYRCTAHAPALWSATPQDPERWTTICAGDARTARNGPPAGYAMFDYIPPGEWPRCEVCGRAIDSLRS